MLHQQLCHTPATSHLHLFPTPLLNIRHITRHLKPALATITTIPQPSFHPSLPACTELSQARLHRSPCTPCSPQQRTAILNSICSSPQAGLHLLVPPRACSLAEARTS